MSFIAHTLRQNVCLFRRRDKTVRLGDARHEVEEKEARKRSEEKQGRDINNSNHYQHTQASNFALPCTEYM